MVPIQLYKIREYLERLSPFKKRPDETKCFSESDMLEHLNFALQDEMKPYFREQYNSLEELKEDHVVFDYPEQFYAVVLSTLSNHLGVNLLHCSLLSDPQSHSYWEGFDFSREELVEYLGKVSISENDFFFIQTTHIRNQPAAMGKQYELATVLFHFLFSYKTNAIVVVEKDEKLDNFYEPFFHTLDFPVECIQGKTYMIILKRIVEN